MSKLEKSDADIANPKKNAKAATWINRGRVYYDAAAEPTANLFAPMETTLLKLSVGDPTSTEEVTLNGSKAIAWNYPYFIAYERDGKIVAWKQLQEIKEGNQAADSAAASIEIVVDGIGKIAESSRSISEISKDQANAMDQAEQGVNQISEVVQSNSATAEESSATSQELSAQAISLDELISKFILPQE
mgnify:CR=1 FL=1